MPNSWFRQEFGCEFLQTDDAAFAYEDVMSVLTDDVAPLFPTAPAPAAAVEQYLT